ncbi:MAG: hypothetical protein HQ510_02015 [Candidatus Marinimicrobia bacterium]|nr:hypothetical protein [Candidatus Neomarinimicrobiota bacterium]
MKKVLLLNSIIILIMISFVFTVDRKDSNAPVKDEQFKIESKKLKIEYAALEKQISDYYSEEFKHLKEQQTTELETLHRELKEKYYELQKKYDVKDSRQNMPNTDARSLKKDEKIKPKKGTPRKPTATKQKKKPGAK